MPATPFSADIPPQEDALQTGNVDRRIIPVLAAGLDPVADKLIKGIQPVAMTMQKRPGDFLFPEDRGSLRFPEEYREKSSE